MLVRGATETCIACPSRLLCPHVRVCTASQRSLLGLSSVRITSAGGRWNCVASTCGTSCVRLLTLHVCVCVWVCWGASMSNQATPCTHTHIERCNQMRVHICTHTHIEICKQMWVHVWTHTQRVQTRHMVRQTQLHFRGCVCACVYTCFVFFFVHTSSCVGVREVNQGPLKLLFVHLQLHQGRGRLRHPVGVQ